MNPFRRMAFQIVLVVCLGDLALAAQQPPPGGGPWERDLMMRVSDDGSTFGPERLFEKASGVPSLIRDQRGRLLAAFQWFPSDQQESWDRVAVKISEDGGNVWSKPQAIRVAGLPSSYQRPFDPTLAVLDDGRIRIYFSSSPEKVTTLGASVGTYSAISSDGIDYTFEPGLRFGVEGKAAIDPAVLKLGNAWHYTAPAGRPQDGAYHATSLDGLNFTRVDDIPSVENVNWTGNLVSWQDGMRFYGSPGRALWWAFSKDGKSWTAPNFLSFQGGDPSLVPTGDGHYLLVYVGGGGISPGGTTTRYLPLLRNTTTLTTGLALANTSSQEMQVTLTAYSDAGTMLAGQGVTNPRTLTIPAAGQKAFLVSELLLPGFQTTQGWIRIASTVSALAGFFLFFDTGLTLMDGADLSSRIMQNFVLPEAVEAELCLVNPGTLQGEVMVQLTRNEGQSAARTTLRIPPGGRWSERTDRLFASSALAEGGYLWLSSNTPLSALEVLGMDRSSRAVLNSLELTGSQSLYAPQFVAGDGWETTVTVVNLEERATLVTARLISDEGTPIGRPAILSLAPRGRAILTDASVLMPTPRAGPIQGYLHLSSDSTRIQGAVRFGDPEGTQFQAALPLVYQTKEQWLFAHVASNEIYFTGVAVLNSGGENAAVTLTVFDAMGKEAGLRTVTLPPGTRLVKLLPEILTNLPPMSGGYFRVSASQPVVAYAVFGTHSLSVLSAIPGN